MRRLDLNLGRVVAKAVFDHETPDILALAVDPLSADIGLPVYRAIRVRHQGERWCTPDRLQSAGLPIRHIFQSGIGDTADKAGGHPWAKSLFEVTTDVAGS